LSQQASRGRRTKNPPQNVRSVEGSSFDDRLADGVEVVYQPGQKGHGGQMYCFVTEVFVVLAVVVGQHSPSEEQHDDFAAALVLALAVRSPVSACSKSMPVSRMSTKTPAPRDDFQAAGTPNSFSDQGTCSPNSLALSRLWMLIQGSL